MRLVDKKNKISFDELKKMSQKMFGDLVKAVVDVEKEVMVVNGEMHADEETFLINQGSKQENLWEINLYPQNKKENFIEFDSIINFPPKKKNLSLFVEDKTIRQKIITSVNQLVIKNG